MKAILLKYSAFLFYAWFVIIMILSVIPANPAPKLEEKLEFRLDYLEHFLVFIPLGFLWAARKKTLVITLLVIFVASAIPEIIQIAVPYRRFNPIDLAFNILGTTTGYLSGFVNPLTKIISQKQV